MSGNIPRLGIIIPLLGMLGCATPITIGYDGPCPSRPELISLPVDLQIQTPPDAIWIVAQNQLKLKQHIIDLEDLSGCEK